MNLARIKESNMKEYNDDDDVNCKNGDNDNENIRILNIDTKLEESELSLMIDKIREIKGINESQKIALERYIMSNGGIFTKRIGRCNSYVHSFEVTDLSSFNHKSRPIPSALMSKTDEVIDKMLLEGIIEHSNIQSL